MDENVDVNFHTGDLCLFESQYKTNIKLIKLYLKRSC